MVGGRFRSTNAGTSVVVNAALAKLAQQKTVRTAPSAGLTSVESGSTEPTATVGRSRPRPFSARDDVNKVDPASRHASTATDHRHPQAATSQPVSGRKTVLASPPKTVTVARARSRWWPSATPRPTTAKAGSYSVAAMHSPSPAHAM